MREPKPAHRFLQTSIMSHKCVIAAEEQEGGNTMVHCRKEEFSRGARPHLRRVTTWMTTAGIVLTLSTITFTTGASTRANDGKRTPLDFATPVPS